MLSTTVSPLLHVFRLGKFHIIKLYRQDLERQYSRSTLVHLLVEAGVLGSNADSVFDINFFFLTFTGV